jgi:hypothetical protein
MYGVVRQYDVDPGTISQIVERAREGFLPLISKAPGFVSYRIFDAGSKGLVTVSTFQDKAGADESVRLAATWVRENLATLVPDPPRVTSGELRIRHIREGAHFGSAVMRRYRFEPQDVDELMKRVSTGLVPKLTDSPGFAAYVVMDAGDGVVVSLNAYVDQASADAAHTMATEWVMENLAPFLKSPPEVVKGTVRLSRP